MASSFSFDDGRKFVAQRWDDSIVPALQDYIRIPNQSPLYDPQWATNGLIDQAVDLMVQWVRDQQVPGLVLEVRASDSDRVQLAC
jgi:hypothetical protein